jgi:hypothetical protein
MPCTRLSLLGVGRAAGGLPSRVHQKFYDLLFAPGPGVVRNQEYAVAALLGRGVALRPLLCRRTSENTSSTHSGEYR